MSHLRYTESAKSSRAETIQDAYNRTFLISQLTGSDLLAFKVNASSCCYGIKLDRGLADDVRKAVSKANADLAVARAEEHMMEMKTLEEHI